MSKAALNNRIKKSKFEQNIKLQLWNYPGNNGSSKKADSKSLPKSYRLCRSNTATLDNGTEGLEKDLDIHEDPEVFNVTDLALLPFSALICKCVSA